MPKVVRMLEKSKAAQEHNQGPISPITREGVRRAGSLRKYYEKEARFDPFAQDVVQRLKKVRPGKSF